MGHTMCSEVESCAGATTCHIIPRWSNKTERPLVRGFFLVVWLLAICAISFHFYTLLVKFLENEAATSVNYNQEHFEFPDITLCPLPPFSLRTIEHLGLYENYTQAKTPEELEIITARAKIEAHNFIVRCRFNGKTCSFKNFTPMFDPALKQCFLFSPPEDERDIETNGPEYGLDVVLFTENRHKYHVKPVDNPDLVTTEWEQAGVRITVRCMYPVP